jgi:hypothetical protein
MAGVVPADATGALGGYPRTHAAILGATLIRQGVKVFYTRNEKDFTDSGIPKVINPID